VSRPPGNEPYLRPYDRYESITIRGRSFEVPAGQKVLRLFQHLSEAFELDVSRFCWNDDCHTCAFRFVDPQGRRRTALGCQKVAFDGMEILTVPGPIRVREDSALAEEDPRETERGKVDPGR
jgi:predicted molibdopterin-dependent oxidoreductase YjgC